MMNLPNTAYPIYRNKALPFTYEGVDYNIDVYAVAGDYYLPERMYMPNGDPGYPAEEDFWIEKLDAKWYLDGDDSVEIEPTEEMTEALEKYLCDGYVEFEYPEEPEPEPDRKSVV